MHAPELFQVRALLVLLLLLLLLTVPLTVPLLLLLFSGHLRSQELSSLPGTFCDLFSFPWFLLFVVSLNASINQGVFEVRATSGNTHLGGEDFDQRIMKYCISQVRGLCVSPAPSKSVAIIVVNTSAGTSFIARMLQ